MRRPPPEAGLWCRDGHMHGMTNQRLGPDVRREGVTGAILAVHLLVWCAALVWSGERRLVPWGLGESSAFRKVVTAVARTCPAIVP